MQRTRLASARTARGGDSKAGALNGLLDSIYAAADDPVADVADAFQIADQTLVDGTPARAPGLCDAP
jgi:hypothetical protein